MPKLFNKLSNSNFLKYFSKTLLSNLFFEGRVIFEARGNHFRCYFFLLQSLPPQRPPPSPPVLATTTNCSYLSLLNGSLRSTEVILIKTKIKQTFSRLLCTEHEGVRPDIVTLGKALSGGCYPVGSSLAFVSSISSYILFSLYYLFFFQGNMDYAQYMHRCVRCNEECT